MLLPNRNGSAEANGYRYGFQGQEKDDEIKGDGNSINYKYRMHDPRIGRFFATDPLESKYSYYSPYQFSGNKPIQFVELEGLEEGWGHMLSNYYINRKVAQATTDNEEEQWKIQANLNLQMHTTGIVVGGVATVMVWGAYGTVAAAELAFAYPMTFATLSNETVGFIWGLGTDEPYINPMTVSDDISSNGRRALAGGFGSDLMKSATKALREVRRAINPSNSNMNCVDCAIQFQRMISLGVNDVLAKVSDGVPAEKVGIMVKEVFGRDNVFEHAFSNKSAGLFSDLNNVGQESVIILGKLLKPRPNGVTHHAFNAVRGEDNIWRAVDAQQGLEHSKHFLDSQFSYYTIFETFIDNASDVSKTVKE